MSFVKCRTFKSKFLKEELGLPYDAIEKTITGTDRWSNHFEIIFEYEGKFYEACYSEGATECQDESAWEYDEEVHCIEVELKDTVVRKYVPVREDVQEEFKSDKSKVSQEDIDRIFEEAKQHIDVVAGKTLVLTVILKNGFTITEAAGCVSPENFDEEVGMEIATHKIKDKLWLLEGYKLQCKLFGENI